MGIIKKIKKQRDRKKKLNLLKTADVVNIKKLEKIYKTIIFVSKNLPFYDK